MVLKEILLLKVNMPENFSGLSDSNGDLVRFIRCSSSALTQSQKINNPHPGKLHVIITMSHLSCRLRYINWFSCLGSSIDQHLMSH